MGIGSRIGQALGDYRDWRLSRGTSPAARFHRNGANRLLLEGLPARSEDVVLDVGGYQGDWTAEVQWRYGCQSVVFEPVPAFQEVLSARFSCNQRIRVVNAGLASTTSISPLWVAGDGSSAFRDGGGSAIDVQMLDAAEAIETYAPTGAACIKLNIEGAEYDVLERLLQAGVHRRVRCFLIQFHDVAPECLERRRSIRQALEHSHSCVFDYPFVWEKWVAK